MTPLIYTFIILPLSLLPMGVLYLLSDVLFLLLFHLIPYRKKVVFDNLRRSFPEKSEGEIHALAKEFYRHFADLIVESLKGFTISEREINRRFKIKNPEALLEHFKRSESVLFVGGHYGNWEWLAIALRQQISHRAAALYKPLSNRFLDRKMRSTRGKYGLEMISIQKTAEFLETELKLVSEKRTLPFVLLFGIDQAPGDPRKAHWARFLNQDTGIPFGAEKYAKLHSLPVFYGIIHKPKRGHYEFEMRPLAEPPHTHAKGWILEQATLLLEQAIRKDPRYWLWTHRRWKRAKPADLP